MAANKVIVTAGEAIKKEFNLVSGSANPATFVMPVAGGVAPATAGYAGQIAIVDYTSIDGLEQTLPKEGKVFNTGDQIPVLYPTNGCLVNVYADSSASGSIADGANLTIGTNGSVKTAGAEDGVIGIAREAVTVTAGTPVKVIMEVLK